MTNDNTRPIEGRGLLLSSTYFGPVQWYSKLCHCAGRNVWVEACESFTKQTYRNRCYIATATGMQALTVPVSHGDSMLMKDMEISDHGNWRHLHWQALQTAYGESAFFEYYQDDVRPFFERKWRYLLDFNMEITSLMCRLLDIDVDIRLSDTYIKKVNQESFALDSPLDIIDLRDAIRPKNAPADAEFAARPYYQVYRQRHGFLPNASVLDLLFNEGPEAPLFL